MLSPIVDDDVRRELKAAELVAAEEKKLEAKPLILGEYERPGLS